MIDAAGRFAQECLDRTDHLLGTRRGRQKEGEASRRTTHREFAAWEVVRSKCMAANACLTARPEAASEGPEVRQAARGSQGRRLARQTQVDEVRAFSRVLRIVHDEPLLVIHPSSGRGWRFTIRDL